MSKRRMAWEQLPSKERSIVRRALDPHQRILGIEQDDGVGFNQKLWEGANSSQFIENSDNLRSQIIQELNEGNLDIKKDKMIDYLTNQRAYSEEDAIKEIDYVSRNVIKGRVPASKYDILPVSYGVPNAQADEGLSRAALELSGWKDVQDINGTSSTSTDIFGVNPQGREILIDAQSRLNRWGDLNLSLGNQIISDNDLEQMRRMANPNDKLMDFVNNAIDQSRRYDRNSGREGKLLQTDSDFNKNRSNYFEDGLDRLVKDGIISSNRQGYSSSRVHPDGIRFDTRKHGPYNPELPYDWDLVDLNQVRDALNKLNLGKVTRGSEFKSPYTLNIFEEPKHINGRPSYAMSISIPNKHIKTLRGGDMGDVSQTVRNALVK